MFRLEIDVRTPAFGSTRREELHRIEQILQTVARQLGLGAPPNGRGRVPIHDGAGEIVGSYRFDGDSLHAPNSKQRAA
jgi:hypothetical protein